MERGHISEIRRNEQCVAAFEIVNLNGEDEGECDESLLSARQLLHFASARSVVRVE